MGIPWEMVQVALTMVAIPGSFMMVRERE